VLSVGAESPATSPSIAPKPVHDAPPDDWVGELPELPVAPSVELARGDPELRDAEGDEVLSAMSVEDDVSLAKGSVDDSGDERLDVEAVEGESAI
jgi:hypothetical protein